MMAAYSEALELLKTQNRNPYGKIHRYLITICFDGDDVCDMEMLIYKKMNEGIICELWQEKDEDEEKIQELAPEEMLNFLRIFFGPMQ